MSSTIHSGSNKGHPRTIVRDSNGNLYHFGNATDIYKSTDDGSTWTQIATLSVGDSTYPWGLAIDSSDTLHCSHNGGNNDAVYSQVQADGTINIDSEEVNSSSEGLHGVSVTLDSTGRPYVGYEYYAKVMGSSYAHVYLSYRDGGSWTVATGGAIRGGESDWAVPAIVPDSNDHIWLSYMGHSTYTLSAARYDPSSDSRASNTTIISNSSDTPGWGSLLVNGNNNPVVAGWHESSGDVRIYEYDESTDSSSYGSVGSDSATSGYFTPATAVHLDDAGEYRVLYDASSDDLGYNKASSITGFDTANSTKLYTSDNVEKPQFSWQYLNDNTPSGTADYIFYNGTTSTTEYDSFSGSTTVTDTGSVTTANGTPLTANATNINTDAGSVTTSTASTLTADPTNITTDTGSVTTSSANPLTSTETVISISGTVTDGGTALGGATVVAIQHGSTTENTTTTDSNGDYSFENLPSGEYHVYVRGYENETKHSITV